MSDHPGLVGKDAPNLSQVRRLGYSTSLAQYARRRERICGQLASDFIEMVDRRGIFRTPCLESMAILGLAADLIDHLREWTARKHSCEIADVLLLCRRSEAMGARESLLVSPRKCRTPLSC